jgi:hypothetical protein
MRIRRIRSSAAIILIVSATLAPDLRAQVAGATTLGAGKKAVEIRFIELQKTSTVRLIEVKTVNRPNVGAILEVALQPPTSERFEFHAETALALMWQALFKVPDAFKEIARVQLTLARGPRTMIVDCPIQTIEGSFGYIDFARVKKECRVR